MLALALAPRNTCWRTHLRQTIQFAINSAHYPQQVDTLVAQTHAHAVLPDAAIAKTVL